MTTTMLSRLTLWLGDLLAPVGCAACDERVGSWRLFCPSCATSVARWSESGEPLAFGVYGGALAQALLRLKYGSRPDLGPRLGLLLRDQMLPRLAGDRVEVVVPVPVPRLRLQDRGYNQAALLAAPLVGPLNARFAPLALKRREGIKQAALGRADRLVNLQGAFQVREPSKVEGRRVLLIDDVSTTGATLEACTQALMQGGARSVRSLVVARSQQQ